MFSYSTPGRKLLVYANSGYHIPHITIFCKILAFDFQWPLVVFQANWSKFSSHAFSSGMFSSTPFEFRRYLDFKFGKILIGLAGVWLQMIRIYIFEMVMWSLTSFVTIISSRWIIFDSHWFEGPYVTFNVFLIILGDIEKGWENTGLFPDTQLILPVYPYGTLGYQKQPLATKWLDGQLQWNIKYTKITIFGESAGSASVHFQLLTPYSKGLFHGAIMQSGTALSPWATGRLFKYTATELAKRFSCPIESEELVRCLQKVDHRRLDEMYYYFMGWNSQPFYFAPRIDGDFIPDEPATLLKNGNYTNVPVIMGSVKDEGALESAEMYTFPILIKRLQDQFKQNGPISLMLLEDEDPVNTAAKVYSRYLNGVFINDHNADNLTQLYTDRLFLISLDWSAELMAPHGPVYTYELHHKGEYGYTSLMHLLGLRLPQANNWVSHGDDLMYVLDILGQSWLKLNTPEDLAVREIFTTTWTNFARTRIPTPDNRLGVNWTVTGGKEALCHLNILPTPQMKKDQRQTIRKFWESLPLRINKLINGRCIYNGENKSRTNNTDAYISNKLIFDDSIFNLCK
ncbi:unnamed protein product, partial [Meganyctiphanes norvegica]